MIGCTGLTLGGESIARLPNDIDQVRLKLAVGPHQSHLFRLGLCNQQTVKRVSTIHGEFL